MLRHRGAPSLHPTDRPSGLGDGEAVAERDAPGVLWPPTPSEKRALNPKPYTLEPLNL